MKDYRSFTKYEIDEWEESAEWKAGRLDFLWSIRDYNFKLYMELGLNEEKQDMYCINDNKVLAIATKSFHSVDMEAYDRQYININIRDKYILYQKLINLKKNNLKEFLLKNNCNLYEYLDIRYAQSEEFYYLKKEM